MRIPIPHAISRPRDIATRIAARLGRHEAVAMAAVMRLALRDTGCRDQPQPVLRRDSRGGGHGVVDQIAD